MRVLVIKPHKRPEIQELADLKAMQKCVGGYIQAIYPWDDTPAALVCDEDGLQHGEDWNRYICKGVAIKGTIVLSNPCLGRDSGNRYISGGVFRIQKLSVLQSHLLSTQRNIDKRVRKRMREEVDFRETNVLAIMLDPKHVGQRQPMISQGDLRAFSIRYSLSKIQTVENLLGVCPIQRENTGSTPMIEIFKIIKAGVEVVIRRRFKVQVVWHKGRQINRTGAVFTN